MTDIRWIGKNLFFTLLLGEQMVYHLSSRLWIWQVSPNSRLDIPTFFKKAECWACNSRLLSNKIRGSLRSPALRPFASLTELSSIWDEFVRSVVAGVVRKISKRIRSYSSQGKAWSQISAQDPLVFLPDLADLKLFPFSHVERCFWMFSRFNMSKFYLLLVVETFVSNGFTQYGDI